MRLWQDGIIALLACIGLASVFWAVIRTIFFPLAPQRQVTVLISARGDGEDLEAQIRTLTLAQRGKSLVGEILLVDCGLTDEGQKLCRLMARQYHRVSFCNADDIQKYVT